MHADRDCALSLAYHVACCVVRARMRYSLNTYGRVRTSHVQGSLLTVRTDGRTGLDGLIFGKKLRTATRKEEKEKEKKMALYIEGTAGCIESL